MIGIWLNPPVVQAVTGVTGMIVPSTIGPVTYGPVTLGVPSSCRISAAGSARRHAAVSPSVPGQPAAAANAMPRVVPSEWGASDDRGELSLVPRFTNPAASGAD